MESIDTSFGLFPWQHVPLAPYYVTLPPPTSLYISAIEEGNEYFLFKFVYA